MKNKMTQAAVGGSSIAALVLLSAVVQAHSIRYEQVKSVSTDLKTATDLALSTVPGMLIEAELEKDDGRFVWEIEIVDQNQQRISLELDGQSGEILERELEDDALPDLTDVLSLDDALSLVQVTDDSLLIEAELDEEAGELVWEFELIDSQNAKSEQRIHGITGNVL